MAYPEKVDADKGGWAAGNDLNNPSDMASNPYFTDLFDLLGPSNHIGRGPMPPTVILPPSLPTMRLPDIEMPENLRTPIVDANTLDNGSRNPRTRNPRRQRPDDHRISLGTFHGSDENGKEQGRRNSASSSGVGGYARPSPLVTKSIPDYRRLVGRALPDHIWDPNPPLQGHRYTGSRFIPISPRTNQGNAGNDTRKPYRYIPRETPVPAKSTQTQEEPEQITPLPYGMDLIYAENRRMSAEEKRRKRRKRKKLAETEPASEDQWPGDPTEYPAWAWDDVQLPNSEYRAKAIHIGKPRYNRTPGFSVYAVRKQDGTDIEFRRAADGSSIEEILRGPLTKYRHIRFNDYFREMNQRLIELWVMQLLAMVPGQNDAVVKWTRDTPKSQEASTQTSIEDQ